MKHFVTASVLLLLAVACAADVHRSPVVFDGAAVMAGAGSTAPVTATFYVATTGCSDSGPGSSGAPWCTLQKAANTATAGQSVSVAAGTYQERVTFPNPGTAGNPITFTCAVNRACIVDGGTSGGTGWVQAPTADFPTGTFEKSVTALGMPGTNLGVDPIPAHVTLSDQQLVFVKPGHPPALPYDYMTMPDTSPEWDGILGACRAYSGSPIMIRCRFQDLGNPGTKALKFAPQYVGAFHVSGSTKGYLTFDGFYFKNAYSCLVVENQAHHVTLQNSTCTNGYYSAWIKDGAHNNLFQNNTWFKNWIYADHGKPRYTLVNTPNLIQENIFFAMREAMPISSSVYITDQGDNNKILNNLIQYTGAAGVYLWSSNLDGDPSYTYSNTEIGGNTIERCQDYCFQIQDTKAVGLKFHDNIIKTYYNGTRFGRILDTSGSVYVYRNTYSNELGCPDCGRGGDLEFSAVTSILAGILPNGVKGYWYHNTYNSADSALLAYASGNCSGSPCPQNLNNMFFVNDLFTAKKLWILENITNNAEFFSGNWVGGTSNVPGTTPSWWTAPNVRVPGERVWTDAESAFALPAGHPAIDLGLNLSASWSAGAAGTQPALPGMGSFVGSAPDAGAKEFSTE